MHKLFKRTVTKKVACPREQKERRDLSADEKRKLLSGENGTSFPSCWKFQPFKNFQRPGREIEPGELIGK